MRSQGTEGYVRMNTSFVVLCHIGSEGLHRGASKPAATLTATTRRALTAGRRAMSLKSRAELELLSRDELIELALRGGQAPPKARLGSAPWEGPPPSKKQRRQKAFDMSRYAQRHVALRVAYIGTAYQGFQYQAEAENTVEGRLLEALTRTCLITDRESCGISCGGRTDRGVSALGQVRFCTLISPSFSLSHFFSPSSKHLSCCRMMLCVRAA